MKKLPGCPVLLAMREREALTMRGLIEGGLIADRITATEAGRIAGMTSKRSAMALQSCGYQLRRSSAGRYFVKVP